MAISLDLPFMLGLTVALVGAGRSNAGRGDGGVTLFPGTALDDDQGLLRGLGAAATKAAFLVFLPVGMHARLGQAMPGTQSPGRARGAATITPAAQGGP